MNRTNVARKVTITLLLGLLMTVGLASQVVAARESDREAKQAQLDAACEQAREQHLAPLREEFIEECVREEQFSTREECETFYADYGAQSGKRAPLFYDLPECVEAFEHQNSQRQP